MAQDGLGARIPLTGFDALNRIIRKVRFGGDELPLIEMYFGKGALTDEQKAELSRKVTDLIVNEAKQPQHYTWVIIQEVPAENWMVDRLTLPELKAKLMAEKK
jgi:4-oxalocrotonate tautomerase family enzyme